jgi:Domain of unknown function (DUF5615)
MRILLDENFPLELVKDFVGHECAHVAAIGWKGAKNGELLSRAVAAGFEVLVTFDTGIPKDHDITKRSIAVFVVQPEGQGPSATRALLGEILVALGSCEPGQVRTITNRLRKRLT